MTKFAWVVEAFNELPRPAQFVLVGFLAFAGGWIVGVLS